MLFNSFQFLLFFPTVTALYFASPQRFRWQLLLAASCIFYIAFIPAYLLILAVTILIDYSAALVIETPGLCAQYRLRCFDYFRDARFREEDFSNSDHLNERGARKLSRIIDEEALRGQFSL